MKFIKLYNNFDDNYERYIIQYCRLNRIELSIEEHFIIPSH